MVEADAVDKATVSLNFSQKLRITPIDINNVLQVSRVSFYDQLSQRLQICNLPHLKNKSVFSNDSQRPRCMYSNTLLLKRTNF